MESLEMEMERIFKSLLKKGHITDAEFQKLMFIEKFDARKSAAFDILMVKDETTAVEILNMFRRTTSRFFAEENTGNHPLLSAVVADCIFGHLPMKDVLNCRLVCPQWRTASSNILRKRVTITFKTQGPYSLMKAFENCLTDIPFQSFKFLGKNDGWNATEIEAFFEKCGANIKKLRFSPTRLFKEGKKVVLQSYDITPLILNSCNLTKLKVVGCSVARSGYKNELDTLLELQLSEMSPLKFISVEGCLIYIHDAMNMKIKPLKIALYDVTFKRGPTIQKKIILNDVIDFSEATKLNLYSGCCHTDMQFDMAGEELNAQSFHLIDIQPKNWTSATGKVYFFHLQGSDFKEKNQLQIQQLYCAHSTINFSALPITIEKLHFSDLLKFDREENINFPYLKYIRFDYNHDFLKVAQYLSQCPNIVELELSQRYPNAHNVIMTLNVNCIPKSVKRMKIYFNNTLKFTNRNEDGGNAGQGMNEGGVLSTPLFWKIAFTVSLMFLK